MVRLNQALARYAFEQERENFGYHLVEPPVLDSLSALARVPQKNDLMLVGGTALSLYCYDKLPNGIRKTDDIDVNSRNYLTRSQFKGGLAIELSQVLEKMGYESFIMKSHKDFSLKVIEQTSFNDAFYVCIGRRSKTYRELSEKRITREFENAIEKGVPEREDKVLVARFEDALAPKIQMLRPKDLGDISAAIKYGPEVDMKYLEDALVIWSGGSDKIALEHMEKFRKMRTSLL